MARPVSLHSVLANLADSLAFEIEEGRSTAEVSGATLRELAKPIPPRHGALPTLAAIATAVSTCTKCGLHKTRTRTVPGQGSPHPEIMFVGEGPGEEEDRQGLAFVGAAGQLLTKMIEAMGLTREEVFIGNIVKCRPPNNRQPTAEEMQTCIPYLERQIEILKPRIIVALGATAMKGLMRVETGITRLRGTWMSYRGIDLMPTFHPAYLLRYPPAKHDAWKDLQDVLARLGRRPPPRPGRK
jgi:DNA polymerase